jgi:hypothetical protein
MKAKQNRLPKAVDEAIAIYSKSPLRRVDSRP